MRLEKSDILDQKRPSLVRANIYNTLVYIDYSMKKELALSITVLQF